MIRETNLNAIITLIIHLMILLIVSDITLRALYIAIGPLKQLTQNHQKMFEYILKN